MAKNFGDKLVGSIGWLLVGLIIFGYSFVMLYRNEGRLHYRPLAESAVAIEQVGDSQNLAYVTGSLQTPDLIGDDLYLKPGKYAAIQRTAETYAWEEKREVSKSDNVYYKYEAVWTEQPDNSEEFEEHQTHQNPKNWTESQRLIATPLSVGDITLEEDQVGLLALQPLTLNQELVTLAGNATLASLDDHSYIYLGNNSLTNPMIGDSRIRYSILPVGDRVTVFGRAEADGTLAPHHDPEAKKLYRMFDGIREDALAQLDREYDSRGKTGWLLGLIVMWIGLMLILRPVSVGMELIPFLGNLGKSALAIIAAVVAVILTIITSLLSRVIQSPIALGLISLLIVAAIGYWYYQREEAKPSKAKKK